MKQNCYNALDIIVEKSLSMKEGRGCLSELVCANMVELSLLLEEKGGVNIFAKKFALSLRVGMRRYGGAVSFV